MNRSPVLMKKKPTKKTMKKNLFRKRCEKKPISVIAVKKDLIRENAVKKKR